MKNLFLILMLLSAIANGQNQTTITEQVVPMDGVSRNSLTVIIKDANTEDIKKAWKKHLKDLKGKVSDKTFIFADDCKVKEMGDNTFDIYSVVEEATNQSVKLVVAFDLGGAYLSKSDHPDKFLVAEKILYDFATEQVRELVRAEIDVTGKLIGTYEKDLSELEKDKAGIESDIAELEKKIVEARLTIEVNLGNQANKQKQIDAAKVALVALEVRLKAIK